MTSSTEKFEILSAYLDDEASWEECCLVEQWLDSDPVFRQQYQAQRRLKTAIRSFSVSSLLSANTAAETDVSDILRSAKSEPYSAQKFADNGTKNINVERANVEKIDVERTNTERTNIENVKPDEFSSHTAIATDSFSSTPVTSHQTGSSHQTGYRADHQAIGQWVADTLDMPNLDVSNLDVPSQRMPHNVSNTSSNVARHLSSILWLLPALKNQNILAILVVLLTALTAFSFGSVMTSLEGDRIRRVPGKVTEADSFLLERKPLILFSIK